MQTPLTYLETLAHSLVRGCTARTPGGVTLFTPDGVASYNALWLRDFSYMMEYAGESVQPDEAVGCVRFAIGGRREDGWMPDRIYADGRAIYAAGEAGKPVGRANLDNTPFLVFIVYDLLPRLPEPEARALFAEWAPALAQGLAVIPLSPAGLVYSDPTDPHSPYGFTDTVAKTGELMMESLLLWRACRKMEAMGERYAGGADPRWTRMAETIERNLNRLYDAQSGMYLAATQDCAQIDIWGNAYLLYIGFPAGVAEKTILQYLLAHVMDYTYLGQIRHLPRGEYWQRLLIDVPRETYQNGAYWATATGWVAWCLNRVEPDAAARLLNDAVACFNTDGSYECVNESYRKLPRFVVSATNTLGGLRRILAESPTFSNRLEAVK
ncbi:MAG TPA: hypothetical protein PKN45_08735 [Candidatus Limiplasma sp.]|nr:hypothetical protein [Candidatus Limiplasma sp.]